MDNNKPKKTLFSKDAPHYCNHSCWEQELTTIINGVMEVDPRDPQETQVKYSIDPIKPKSPKP